MRVKNIYPSIKKEKVRRRTILSVFRWPFIVAVLASVIVNICTGKPFWSVIVAFSLYAVWNMFVSPDLVEYNIINQSVKGLMYICILLALIDIVLVNGFALHVIPIVGFGGLAICAVLFLSNVKTQKYNMTPLVNFIFVSIIGSAIALYFHHGVEDWPFIVLLGLSVVFLFVLIIVLRENFRREFKKNFHAK